MAKSAVDIAAKHGAALRKKRNVVTWSRKLKPKLKGGVPTDVKAFRVYVKEKVALKDLKIDDIIPSFLENTPTDVVVIGDVKAAFTDRQSVVRPVVLGLGIGNWDITEGSLGELYTRSDSPEVIFAGTNAHIVTPSPFLAPSQIIERRILQPGAYALGKDQSNVVGTYHYHKRLEVYASDKWNSLNWLGFFIWAFVQLLKQVFGSGGAKATAVGMNLIDFGVYIPTVPHLNATVDDVLKNEPIIGHLFASSEFVGIVCKIKYIIEEGYKPLHGTAGVEDGDVVKGSSFWGDYETTVLDDSVSLVVDYGEFAAEFDDVIFLVNDGTIRGGWSGSGFRLIKRGSA